MNNRRSTPSGDGRGRGRGGAPRGGNPRGGGSRGGSSSGGFRSDSRGFRSDSPRGGAPRGDDRGFRSPARDDRGGFRPERRDDRGERGGFRSEGPRGGAPRGDDRGGFGSRDDRGFRSPARDDRDFRSQGRDDRGGFRPERRDDRGDRGGFRSEGPRGGAPRGDDRGGSRARYGKNERRDEVQTIGGKRAGQYGQGPAAPKRTTPNRATPKRAPAAKAERRPGAIENDRFKTARQPVRDSDFYDRDYTDERDTTEVPGGVRLQKVLAQAGVASRRACEEMIGDGRVTVDGQVVRRFGARVDPTRQIIHVDGKRLPTMPDLVYFAINKPIGVVSTMSDPEGRPSLADYVADRTERLFHVGRLDTETEGLILLTNDGELANRLTHPSYGVQKKYWAKVPGRIKPDLARRLRKGVELEDGIAKADSFTLVQEHGQQALVEIVLHEGRKHIVRRMLEEVGHPVIDLARIEFGPVKLGRLKPGTVRALTVKEVGELYAAVGL
ncbi:pseudouridine synthase [Planomonospora sp. ID67723]|uniref:pseudouridine synthase n=1 Tax=Planomonospora sp. ID67723 TaxID=2738134 RepID=UPI0027DC568A|nr:pseudouridine synthase [Planomonospora sp. ID67723]